ncbi:hypothetical protein GYMLUDRAFT_263098 [Collybiopsis luxurians FD-317 M1]|uniref:Zn(2)-C6 fungal-type domain-containing protein n=1 Tax=Collybiopsis luxurians FD-317 M1 TaxID=944289 RepID=A0A0D0BQD3_9AGAR|nr:hypothetical protein GYMLUDRAFT_263098 [Collybiopsis luxurians FD-317 M1]
MSSGSSVSTPRQFIFKQPTKSLPRGKACLNCRLHKIKCDGVKPICGSCVRIPRDDECKYNAGTSKRNELERRVTRLKARIRELENPETSGSGPQLMNSYFSTNAEITASSSPSSDYSGSSRLGHDPLLGFPDPSISILTILLNNFLPSASQFGFFLNLERFKTTALPEVPFGDSCKPSPALLSSVYLWGAHLSPVDTLRSHETVFLDRALQQVSVEISSATHSAGTMHSIQAEILLSTYFLRKSQLLEAEFHLNGALSLSQSAGLHQIRSDRVFPSSLMGAVTQTDSLLPPARDVIEEGERINGFWAVYCLHRVMLLTLDNFTHRFGGLDSPCREIDTPWPCEYGYGLYNGGILGHSTIDQFMNDLNPVSESIFDSSSYPKAVVLLHAATGLTHRFRRGLETEDASALFTHESFHLSKLITRFHFSLPPLNTEDFHAGASLPPAKNFLILTHVLVSCAYMQIQRIFSSCGVPGALQGCIRTAQNVIRTLTDVNRLRLQHLNPIVGTLCAMACSIFGDQLTRMEILGARDLDDLGSVAPVDPAVLREGLEAGITAMSVLAMDSPLIGNSLVMIPFFA